jgi:hypothetical protein
MDLNFYPLTLDAVDGAHAESLCLFVGEDERPLTGLAGLIDWRLSGRLSRLLKGGQLTGGAGEAVLTPPGLRLGFKKMFLFGIGPFGQPEERYVEQLGAALDKLAQAGAEDVAMEFPSRLSPELGMRTLVDHLRGPGRAIVFAHDPQKLVGALASAAQRGSNPPPERKAKTPLPPRTDGWRPGPRPAEAPSGEPTTREPQRYVPPERKK